ncbi:hypothetical protein DXG01_007561 [Tephrocybe rancida]|nr:hypothetical protein DXG01_007561 [Tephrocybe rancida]
MEKAAIRYPPSDVGVNGGRLERDDMSDNRSGEEGHETSNENTVYLSYDQRDEEKSIDSARPSPSKFSISARGSDIFEFDPNLDTESLLEDDSPYPEVRSAVANFDDPDMPASTLRAWFLGLCWAILIPGMNQFFYLRYPSVAIGGLVAQLLAFPLGRLWARFFPNKTIFGIEINPGPFSIKEHVLVTIMATVGAQSAYATDIVAVQRVFYHQSFPFIYQWLLVMSTQLIGFSIGGVARRFLVAPPSMIWPNALVSCALFNTLHSQSYAGIGQHEGLSRERYFLYAFLASAVWYLVPGYLFEALSVFTWVCWMAPDNVRVNQIFGYRSGLGFSLLTFDWNQIAFIGSPLATPWWAEANVMIGFLFFYWFLTPIFYYTNVWYSQYLPISSSSAYDNTGQKYNLTRIIDANATISMQAYRDYSPVYLSLTFVMSYGLSFLSITATISHAIIHFWKPIKVQFKQSLREQPDIHAQLMAKYPQGMIQAVTNRQIGLNVITELIIGFMIPGGDSVWGVIGPALQFSKGQIYYGTVLLSGRRSRRLFTSPSALTFFFLIGAACPVILWLVTRRYPNSILNYLNFPLIFSGVGQIPPATAVNYVPWAIIGFLFQFVVRRKYFSYWAKYNYVLSAALDAGTAVGVIVVFFCLQYPLNGNIGHNTIRTWWGNQVYKQTLDWKFIALKTVAEGETFGPSLSG